MDRIIENANKVMENSYSPYSNFKVGASILMKDGTYVNGTNIENASYGATNCAERSAIFMAISLGYKKGDFDKIAITSYLDKPTPPCAICRQVMLEFFDKDVEIIMTNKEGIVKKTNIDELVPYQFTEKDLD